MKTSESTFFLYSKLDIYLKSIPPISSHVALLSCVPLLAIPWNIAYQVLLFMGFPRQEYWRRLSFPPPGDLPNPGIKPVSPASLVLSGRFFTTALAGKPRIALY